VVAEKKPDIISDMIEQKSVNMGRNRRMAGSFLPDNVCEVYKEALLSEVLPVIQEVKKEIFVEQIIDEESEEDHPHLGTQLMNNMSQGCSQASIEPFNLIQPKEDSASPSP